GRQGCRRGRHHRVHPGRCQRRGRRAPPVRRQRRADAVFAAARLGGAAQRKRRRPVIPAQFDYVRAGSVDEAVSALHDDAKVLAGGQSLIPLLRLRLAYPEVLVDVSRVAEMRGVREEGDRLVIGAATTHDEVMRDPLVRTHCPVVAEVTATVADPAVRHRGTFGGSLAHADPAGDLPALALALDATMTVAGPGGRRETPASEFFVDYLQSAVGPD